MRSAAPVAPPPTAENSAAPPATAPPLKPPTGINGARTQPATTAVPATGCRPRRVNENRTRTAIIHTESGSRPPAVTANDAPLVMTSPAQGFHHDRATPAPASSTDSTVGQSDPVSATATIWPANTSVAAQ